MAKALVSKYHGPDVANQKEEWFKNAFSKKSRPEDLQEVQLANSTSIVDIIKECVPDQSKSNIRRLIEQGGVSINESRISSIDQPLSISSGDTIKIGKT